MFKVKSIFSDRIYIVYSVTNDSDTPPEFLIYDDEWKWIESYLYLPVE